VENTRTGQIHKNKETIQWNQKNIQDVVGAETGAELQLLVLSNNL
jgi:hypothetical protein